MKVRIAHYEDGVLYTDTSRKRLIYGVHSNGFSITTVGQLKTYLDARDEVSHEIVEYTTFDQVLEFIPIGEIPVNMLYCKSDAVLGDMVKHSSNGALLDMMELSREYKEKRIVNLCIDEIVYRYNLNLADVNRIDYDKQLNMFCIRVMRLMAYD